MGAREQRGQEIAATMKPRREGSRWIVPAQTGPGFYVVDPTKKHCSCPDYELRAMPCKHVYAVEFTMRRETTTPDGSTVTETVTYRKNGRRTTSRSSTSLMRWRSFCATSAPQSTIRSRPRVARAFRSPTGRSRA